MDLTTALQGTLDPNTRQQAELYLKQAQEQNLVCSFKKFIVIFFLLTPYILIATLSCSSRKRIGK